MPTYQYACTECDHAFEQFQSFSEDSLTVCPQCEGRLRKVFNAVGVVFKGSGFYRTDSRSDGKSSLAAKSESATADSGSTNGSGGTGGTGGTDSGSTGSGSTGSKGSSSGSSTSTATDAA